MTPSTQAPLRYSIPAGQAYMATVVPTATQECVSCVRFVTGARTMYTIQFNHRVVLVCCHCHPPGRSAPLVPWVQPADMSVATGRCPGCAYIVLRLVRESELV
ncbi:hypothetical protein ACWDSD_38565 [Streptomyces spiralis]